MQRAREGGRIGVLERRQAAEIRRAMQHAVEAAEFGFDARRHLGVVVGAGAFQVERIVQRRRQRIAMPGDGVVHAIQFRHLAPEQDDGRARLRTSERRGRAEPAVRAIDQDHAASQRALLHARSGRVRTHAFCVSAIMRVSSPDSYSSIVMSQPPINSPWMNSCGNVGQFE